MWSPSSLTSSHPTSFTAAVSIMLKKLLLIFALVAVSYAGTCNSYEREKLNEKSKPCVYKDSKGNPTVGVGFNLNKAGARGEIEGVGADYDAVLNGSQCLDDGQIEKLFNKDMNEANSCAKSWLGSSWSALGSDPQSAVSDMAFNMGCGKLRGFVKLRAALTESPPNYQAAKNEMKDSNWCVQVGGRCGRDVACIHG